MRTKEEYHRKHGILYGGYFFERDRIEGLYKRGEITEDEFLKRFEEEALPHLRDAKTLATMLVTGLQRCSPYDL